MKILCLSYIDEQKFDRMSESERATFIGECLAYDNDLRKNGYFVRLEGLQSARTAKTLRYRSGRVSVTDGPFAESKEMIGGYVIVSASSLADADRWARLYLDAVEADEVEVRELE